MYIGFVAASNSIGAGSFASANGITQEMVQSSGCGSIADGEQRVIADDGGGFAKGT